MTALDLLVEKTAEAVTDLDKLTKFDDKSLDKSADEFYSKLGSVYGNKFYSTAKFEYFKLACYSLLKTENPKEHGDIFNLMLEKLKTEKYFENGPENRPGKQILSEYGNSFLYWLAEVCANDNTLRQAKDEINPALFESLFKSLYSYNKEGPSIPYGFNLDGVHSRIDAKKVFVEAHRCLEKQLSKIASFDKETYFRWGKVLEKEYDSLQEFGYHGLKTDDSDGFKEIASGLFNHLQRFGFDLIKFGKGMDKDDICKAIGWFERGSIYNSTIDTTLYTVPKEEWEQIETVLTTWFNKHFKERLYSYENYDLKEERLIYDKDKEDFRFCKRLWPYLPKEQKILEKSARKYNVASGIKSKTSDIADSLPTNHPVIWTLTNLLLGGYALYSLLGLSVFRNIAEQDAGMCCMSAGASALILGAYDLFSWIGKD